MQYGLLPLPKDDRDIHLGALYDLPALKDIPDFLDIDTKDIKDQQESDFCTGFASATASEVQENCVLSPEWIFARSKTPSTKDSYGQDLRAIMAAHVKYGCIERTDAPFSIKDRSPQFLRDITNWPADLDVKALYHKKASYMTTKGPYDAFDNIRASLWKFRKQKRLAVSGLLWGWPIATERINTVGSPDGGHAIVYRGFDGEYLRMQNSYGKKAGRNGVHLVHRNVVNTYVDMYGSYMFQDITPEEARWYLQNGKKADKNWLLSLLRALLR